MTEYTSSFPCSTLYKRILSKKEKKVVFFLYFIKEFCQKKKKKGSYIFIFILF